ncbi:acyl-CoA thioesterase-2 [Actinocorallia herbida]|uniref:Acyl-CoA thioesterase-2 n=1 Tax=Actinocorallia herbida TaxID=58109 RepID=A0A3N1CWG6_9ACTN|nr:acyl-CoA thioesterase domain-containing protein [Actinocorallia herbida]ROO85565.1 acyl-CoA thioesterase-2 [Actinocorallia herbida]
MSDALGTLLDLLDLERIDDDVFRGRSPESAAPRAFGGQVAAQALVAAARTVGEGKLPHSLHAYFVRAGDPGQSILYLVERVRDGRSFATRRVVARQHGKTIFMTSVSFAADGPGPDHSLPLDVPLGDPEALHGAHPRWMDEIPSTGYQIWDPFEIRMDPPAEGDGATGRSRMWLRAAGALPEDPALHLAILTYASDLTLLSATALSHGHLPGPNSGVALVSLDHAVWFHRTFRADSWLLFDQGSPTTAGGRGLAHARIFTPAGELAASVTQEGLLRTPDHSA